MKQLYIKFQTNLFKFKKWNWFISLVVQNQFCCDSFYCGIRFQRIKKIVVYQCSRKLNQILQTKTGSSWNQFILVHFHSHIHVLHPQKTIPYRYFYKNTDTVVQYNRFISKPVHRRQFSRLYSFSAAVHHFHKNSTTYRREFKTIIPSSERQSRMKKNSFINFQEGKYDFESLIDLLFYRCFFIIDKNAPIFSLENSFYKKQFDKNLSHNVYKKGQWGSYRHLPFEALENYNVTRTVCQLEKPGDFSSLRWIESSLDPKM